MLAALWTVVLWTGSLRAEPAGPVCGAARSALAAEEAAGAVLAAEDDAAVAVAAKELERWLGRLAAEAGPRAPLLAGETVDGPGGPIAAYLASRRGLVEAVREGGLAAALARSRDAAFAAAGRVLEDLAGRAVDCGALAAGSGGDVRAALEAASSRSAGAAGERAPPGPASLAARPRPAGEDSGLPIGGKHGLPAADLRTGLTIVVALALLLIALSPFDPARAREEPRVACRIPAQLRIRGASQPAVVVEVGRRSAKLRTAGGFLAGDRGSLAIGGATAAVRVAWVTSSFAGVTFQRRLDLSRLSA